MTNIITGEQVERTASYCELLFNDETGDGACVTVGLDGDTDESEDLDGLFHMHVFLEPVSDAKYILEKRGSETVFSALEDAQV